MMVVMLCVALLPTFFQTNNARFSGLLCVGNESESEIMGPVRKKRKKNTSVSSYHPPVSIQRRLNNE